MEALGPTTRADLYRGTKQCAPKETRHGPESIMGLGVGHTSSQPLDDLRVGVRTRHWQADLARVKLFGDSEGYGLAKCCFQLLTHPENLSLRGTLTTSCCTSRPATPTSGSNTAGKSGWHSPKCCRAVRARSPAPPT